MQMTMSKTHNSTLNDWFKLSSGETKPDDVEDAPSDNAVFPVFGGNGVIGWSSQSNSDGENIIIGRVGAKCGCVHYYNGNCWITDNALYTKEHKRDYDKRFMAVLLRYIGLERLRSKTGQPLISQGPIHSLKAKIPGINDQKVIAILANTWDTSIGKTEKLIGAKRSLHFALSNNLLSRKHNNVPLKKFLTLVVRDIAKPDKPYWALGIRSHGKGTFRRFVENPNSVAMSTLYRVQHDDIIVNITFA
jgi:type I restriction enzyme S subunit